MIPAGRLVFVFIGGEHQVLHLAPVAAEISRLSPGVSVECICADERTAAALSKVAVSMNANGMQVTRLAPPAVSRMASRITGKKSAAKGPLLAKIRWLARDADAVIAPERTSAALRWFGWRRPLIHFRHGAGDRAPSSERKQRAFDRVFVPGPKDIERAVAQGIDRNRLSAVGYIKMDYLRAQPGRPRLFDNDRNVVVYNPHFDASISSISIARQVIAQFRDQDRYNLVFAPHIRAFENLDAASRAEWQALAEPGHIIVDLGSPKLFDMSFMRAADLYLGDMSSQLYEFLTTPRPAVFLNTHGVEWNDDPRYGGWHLGEVTSGSDEVVDAIDRAFQRHPEVISKQAEAVRFAFGQCDGAIKRAADKLLRTLYGHSAAAL